MNSNGNIGKNKGFNKNNSHKSIGFLPNSLKFISSCIKTASSSVRSASASVAASISGDGHEQQKDQVLWTSFDRLELGPSSFKCVFLLGYSNGFQVFDVEDDSNVNELVSRRDDPVTFLQMQPLPETSECHEGFRASHPLLLVVACEESKGSGLMLNGRDGLTRDGFDEPQTGNFLISPTAVRFYSLRSHNYVHVLRFRSTVYMVRCSPRIIAVGLSTQIYCVDALTLENKFSVLTYPVPQAGGQGMVGISVGYGPMAVSSRWLAYASNNPLQSNTGRLSPQNLTPSPGVSPSTSPSSGSLVARYAMESSKQLAAGLINLGDMGYKTLSKYYQDLIPDGSGSPVSSNSGWKAGRAASAETDIAGTVVIKDFVSRAVVSQFRAHTSPISALCFDPSGTLLVTASIHGNNINIFRIMPSSTKNGSGTQNHDWSSSHVHLYKLHRGVTSAMIQDICFSAYSQWIAIVSSRGTCHIFVLSPFGSENVLQIQNSHVVGPILSPAVSLPWWSTPSFTINSQTFSLPPPTVTLSVVSRIKNGNSGWLNTVTNAASSAAGKASFPSGSFSAVFHNSLPNDLRRAQINTNVLEHLLVYTPSGHVVQYKLLPSFGGETDETASRIGPGSALQVQDEELQVKVEAVQLQAWDVCRRTDWPEREECLSGMTHGRKEALEMMMDVSDSEDNDAGHKDLSKPQDRSHLYLSNAEVQISSGRIPIWQNPKVSFHTMNPVGFDELKLTAYQSVGEIEIEQMPAHEVEIRQRDLLPLFEHFHRLQSGWNDRGFEGGKYPISSQDVKARFPEVTVIPHSKLMSPNSVENSDSGSARNSYLSVIQSAKDSGGVKGRNSIFASAMLNQSTINKDTGSDSFNQSKVGVHRIEDSNPTYSPSSLTSGSLSGRRTVAKEVQFLNSDGVSDVSNMSSNRSDLSMNMLDEGPVNDSLDFEQFFKEEYCKASPSSACPEPKKVVTDLDSSSSRCCDREKSEEEGDNDDMLGGVFAFSEEG